MQTLKEKFQNFITEKDWPMAWVAQEIGYAPSVLSQWLGGIYRGNSKNVEEKVEAWLSLQLARQEESTALPVVPLARTIQMKGVIRTAHEEKIIAVLCGPSGSGKTTACEEYFKDNPHNTILLTCDPGFQLTTVLLALAKALGLFAKGRISELGERVVEELKRRDMVVIFDEAYYLTDTVLEYLRIILFDKGQTGMVLVGLENLVGRIRNLRSDHRQLESRIGLLYRPSEVEESEVKEVLESLWTDLGADLIKAFSQACRKNLRVLKNHLSMTRRQMKANNLEVPTLPAIAGAARYLFTGER